MASSWAVTGQRQTTVSNGQTFVPAMVISFQTGAGNLGNITVQSADYTPAKVKTLLQAAADTVDSIGTLSSGTVPDGTILGS